MYTSSLSMFCKGGREKGRGATRDGKEEMATEVHIIVYFQPFHPSDVMRGQSSVYFLWVRGRVRARVSSIHGENTQKCRAPNGEEEMLNKRY